MLETLALLGSIIAGLSAIPSVLRQARTIGRALKLRWRRERDWWREAKKLRREIKGPIDPPVLPGE
jgi:hypothetical protein